MEELTETDKLVLEIIRSVKGILRINDGGIRSLVKVKDPDAAKPGAGLRKIINGLRQRGYAICSDTRGYWYASGPQELRENAAALKGRAVKILEAAKGMERAADRYDEIQGRLV